MKSNKQQKWEKEFDKLPQTKLTTKQFIRNLLKKEREQCKWEKEGTLVHCQTLCQEDLKAKDKEFIEILDSLKMKTMKGSKSEFQRIKEIEDAIGTGHNLAIYRLNNKIKQIKRKYE